MSMLEIVNQALKGNPDIRVYKQWTEVYVPSRHNGWSAFTNILVVPAVGGLYAVADLEHCKAGLVPTEIVSHQTKFEAGSVDMVFGRLFIDETIGTVATVRQFDITDPAIRSLAPLVDGKLTAEATDDLTGRIVVRLYPDELFAENAMKGVDVNGTEKLVPDSRGGFYA